jgi:hypothetical protein
VPSYLPNYAQGGPSSWFWFWGLSPSDIDDQVAATGAQPVVIKPYASDPGNNFDTGVVYAVVLATYDGAPQTSYAIAQTPEQIGHLLQERSLMPVYVVEDTSGGFGATQTFSVIMAPAEGAWWWWYGEDQATIDGSVQGSGGGAVNSIQSGPSGLDATILSPPAMPTQYYTALPWSEVGTMLNQSGDGMSLVGFGGYDDDVTILIAPDNGQAWWWYLGIALEDVGSLLTQNSAYLIDLHPYYTIDGDDLRFALIMRSA